MVGVGAGFSGAGSLGAYLAVGDSLGEGRSAAALVVAAVLFYVVLSAPRRMLDGERLAQARETPLLSASARACLTVTGSRPRTLILLRSEDPALAGSLKDAGRRVLLGSQVDGAVRGSTRTLASYSAAAALGAVASFSPRAIEQGDEESQGIAASSDLNRETKVPILTTVCFFMPILLVLYAVFSHTYDATRLGELAAFEFIIVDLAFYLSASERGPR
jgi:hypothetical protein